MRATATGGGIEAACPRSKLRADSLSLSIALVLGIAVAQRGFGFIREVLFCRWLDQVELGQWALAYVFLMAAAAIATLGIQGSMNRYLEQFRQRGQLRSYVTRVAVASVVLAMLATVLITLTQHSLSMLIFGRDDRTHLVALLAVGVAIVIGHNFLIDLLSGMRLFRAVSAVQLANSIGFVVLSVGVMAVGFVDAAHLVVAFAGAYLLAAAGALVYVAFVWRSLPSDDAPLAHRSFWPRLMAFSFGLWVYNCLINAYEASSRLLIVHGPVLDESTALAAVGDWHSARVLPLLLATGAALVASTIMPYLSHDWEAGRRREVAQRLRLFVKLTGVGLYLASVAVLWLSPLLFDEAFGGKYAVGQAILPWLLAAGVWSGLSHLMFNYLWCAERLRLSSFAMAVALVVNVALATLLMPVWGLTGTAVALAAANCVQLVLVLVLARRLGMQTDAGVWVVVVLPVALATGAPGASIGLLFIAAAVGSRLLFSRHERALISTKLRGGLERFSHSRNFAQRPA
jgi:polysaccharide transporter, PST family